MMLQNEQIRRKRALMSAKKSINQLTYIKLIDFEKSDSKWIDLFRGALSDFRKIDSSPKFQKPVGDDKSSYLVWIKSSLDFLKGKENYFIPVPNGISPVWANVKILDFEKAIEELWDSSPTNEFAIADKSTGQIAQVYSEEKYYEIHIKDIYKETY
ncbi:hypothetical protein [Halalkalibacterium halodurans]|uniref:hypothetical protein n=1 Tax=Halalkalibacterium halodurans TaxID=86665 RepID=UPI002AA9BD04|nr:hypothetical protein [Halalkalibacterium halodurans]MDY7224714.1 hypothetical protein [Halalkalibacterium halodurans]MDY7243935.1 hypothetical protein [Halalkalibacterium halodurans]